MCAIRPSCQLGAVWSCPWAPYCLGLWGWRLLARCCSRSSDCRSNCSNSSRASLVPAPRPWAWPGLLLCKEGAPRALSSAWSGAPQPAGPAAHRLAVGARSSWPRALVGWALINSVVDWVDLGPDSCLHLHGRPAGSRPLLADGLSARVQVSPHLLRWQWARAGGLFCLVRTWARGPEGRTDLLIGLLRLELGPLGSVAGVRPGSAWMGGTKPGVAAAGARRGDQLRPIP